MIRGSSDRAAEGAIAANWRPQAGPGGREARQITRAVIACFLVSGAVGLVYEVLWIRMLGLVFGHTVFAVTTVLTSFMGGLALGSWVAGRFADRFHRLLTLYGCLEIGIGGYCLLLPTLLAGASQAYLGVARVWGASFATFSVLQFGLVAVLLLPPTTLMGATLPVLARFFVREEATVGRQVGLLYSINTLGAVTGTVLAGYWVVPVLGIRATILMGVVVNVGLGGLVIVFDRHLARLAAAPDAEAPRTPAQKRPAIGAVGWSVALAFALSGAASMVYEVTWTRALALAIGSSTYAFTAMLVAFLAGIAGGSWAFAALFGHRQLGPLAFAYLQLAIGAAALALVPAFGRMPVWFLGLFQLSQAWTFVQAVQLALSFAVMLLPTLLIGATFPCAVRILSRGVDRIGHDAGWIYALNTLGAILGTVAAGFIGVPLLGIQWTMRAGVVINVTAAVAILLVGGARPVWRATGLAAAGVGALGVALLPFWDPAIMSSGAAVYGRLFLPLLRSGEFDRNEWRPQLIYYRDGMSGTVTVHRDGQALSLRVNGKTDAGNTGDMHTQLFSGHIPLLLHPAPRRVLVIGLGSGVTVGAVAQYPVEQIDVIEIEPAVVEAAEFFSMENRRVLADRRVRVIIADGRNFLLNTREPYDVIISEPSNPWIRGLATLFSREFFALAKSRLSPGGIMLQWIQGYGLQPADLQMVVATFRTAFPHATLWHTTLGDNFLLGAPGPLAVPLGRIERAFAGSPTLREDFARVGLEHPAGLLADFLLGAADLARFAAGSALNTDDTLWLEFSAPRSLYDLNTVDLNHAILRGYRSAADPPLSAEDAERLNTAAVRYAIGQAYLAKELPNLAEREFVLAGRLDPAFLPARLAEAELLIQRGRALAAVKQLDDVARRAPGEVRAHLLLASAYQQQGLLEEARAALRHAASLEPRDPETRLRLAALLRQTGDYGTAHREYAAVRRARPEDVEVLIAMAEAALMAGAAEDALRELQPHLVRMATHPVRTQARLQHLAGRAALKAGQPQRAVELLGASVRLHPAQSAARLDLSVALEAASRPAEALEAVERLLAIHPDHLQALRRAGDLAGRLEGGS